MKIKFNSDDDIRLKKTYNFIVVKVVFHEENKYCLQVF